MLLANRKVAELIGRPPDHSAAKTFVYRVHDTPDPQKMKDFVQFIKKFGYKMKIGDIKTTANRSEEHTSELQSH